MARMSRRTKHDAALFLELAAAGNDADAFARIGVAGLQRLVASELTTLSVWDLPTGRRFVVGSPANALSAADIAAFDRHFFEHPLVRFHSRNHRAGAHRISDSM